MTKWANGVVHLLYELFEDGFCCGVLWDIIFFFSKFRMMSMCCMNCWFVRWLVSGLLVFRVGCKYVLQLIREMF